jgi:HAD superfamily hydrolase (TIGR01450 family)
VTDSPSLAEQYDALLVDLDGTLLLAGQVIDHAAESVHGARQLGARVLVVTNNASRSPGLVAERLTARGIPMTADDVVSSPQAAAAMLAATHRAGDPVLVVGADALADAVAGAGLLPVRSADQRPVAVVQGYSPDIGWRDLAEACIALRAGVDWVATNMDSTLPTDRGLLPGNGSLVQALVTATGRQPRVAGKPARPLLDAAAQRAGAQRPLVVGDRLDTDIAAAVSAGMPSLFVLSGVSTAADLLRAPAEQRPSMVSADLRGLLHPAECAPLSDDLVTAAPPSPDGAPGWRVTQSGQRLELSGDENAAGTPIAALAALARSAWHTGVVEVRAADRHAAQALKALSLD